MFNQSESGEILVAAKTAPGRNPGAARSAQAMWFLAGRPNSDGPLRYIAIDSNPFQVGRRSDASLCLPSKSVSSIHAELVDTGACLVLHDRGSTNGTFVNGQRAVEPVMVNSEDLIQFADVAFRVMRQTIQHSVATAHEDVLDQAIVLVLFDRLMNEQAVVPHYQPIVDLRDGGVIGFEVLARSDLSQLHSAEAMFSAAARLGLEAELSQMMRVKAVQEMLSFQNPPHLFLNTHPAELEKPGLIESIKSLRAMNQSQRLTLEMHEKAITDTASMKRLRETLRALDIGLAFDDFGAGQARLLELIDVHPEFLKFDMALIRSVHLAAGERQRLVASLVQMARDVGATPLAEGIESEGERDACLRLGFELAQGFYFGRPVPLTATS